MSQFRFLLIFLVSIFCSQTILSQIEKFKCATNQSQIQQVGQLLSTTWTLKILLVEFSDVKHNTSPAYTYTNFNNLFFSTNQYVSPNMYSPDGEQVFGSMRDYYSIMSDGEFELTGYVVNNDSDFDNVPDWLTLPLRKGQYDSVGFANWTTFLNAALAAAISAGLDISTNSTTKLAVIYAGQTYRGDDTLGTGSGLNPQASTCYYYSGNCYSLYINGEKFGSFAPYRTERPDAKFSEIGINGHEFAHLLGFPDLGLNGYFDMMNGGPYVGPNFRGACPAPFNPQTRKIAGWLPFSEITSNHTYQADYNLRDPEVFQIKNSTNSGNYWLIETRNFNATMTIGSTVTNDYNYYILRNFFPNAANQGVLVWKVTSPTNHGTILHANGVKWPDWPPISDSTLFPGPVNKKVLSPWSDSRTTPTWVPNTKPSTNVGMEIQNEGSGYYTIDFYNSITNLPTTISNNTTLNGIYYAPANINVTSGATLTIEAGTKIYFANGVSLNVSGNAVLNANGTQTNPIRFTFSSASSANQWYGIYVQGSGSSVLRWCTIEYSNISLCLTNNTGSQIPVENCTFRYNNAGLIIGAYGKGKIKSCNIYSNNVGIYCYYNSDVDLIGNRIYNNNGSGISSYSGNLIELFGNVIEYNSGYGINPAYGDVVRIGRVYTWWGYNTIQENGGDEVSNYHAAIELSGASVHDDGGYEIYNYPGDPAINAQSVYWNTDGPQVYGSVNLMPTVYYSLPTWDRQVRTAGSPIGKATTPIIAKEEWMFDPTIPNEEKIQRFKKIIATDSKSEEAKSALQWIYAILRSDDTQNTLKEKENFFGYLEGVRNASAEFENTALQYMILWKIFEKDQAAVIQLSNEALNQATGGEKKWILANLASAYAYSGQIKEAKNSLQNLRENFPDEKAIIALVESDIVSIEAQLAKGEWKPFEKTTLSEKKIPANFELSQNYPNPFNPTTAFSYSLTEPSNVELKIYDYLGREVATLVNDFKDVGTYSVSYNAINLASGIYFYKIQAGKNVSIRKMLLLK